MVRFGAKKVETSPPFLFNIPFYFNLLHIVIRLFLTYYSIITSQRYFNQLKRSLAKILIESEALVYI
jgi:hypothetical protein